MDQLLQGCPVKPAVQLVRDNIFTLAPLIFIIGSEEFKQVRTCASQHCTMRMKLHAANLTRQNITTVNHTCIHPVMLRATEFGAQAQHHVHIVLTANGKNIITIWHKSNITY
jgi:hypothetical protein